MTGFDRDQFIECVMYVGIRHSPKRFVEGEVEQLIKNECLGELGIVQRGWVHLSIAAQL